MVDDDGAPLVVCLDRISMTSSACIGSSFTTTSDLAAAGDVTATSLEEVRNGGGGRKEEMVECRICQEDDHIHALESPCSCNGTLKFAHRKCVQKWCDKKGDITCEICNKVFSPNYTPAESCSSVDVMTIDIRQAWGEHSDPHNPHLLAIAAIDHHLSAIEYEDCLISRTGSVACLGSVGLIFMVVLLLHQSLLLIRDSGIVRGSSKFFRFQMSLLQIAGFLVPCYAMARSWYMAQCGRRRQDIVLGP